VLRDAVAEERRDAGEVEAELERLAPRTQALRLDRLLFALGLLGVLAGAAVATEAAELEKSSDALWGLTVSVLGLIVGLLGGEKAAD